MDRSRRPSEYLRGEDRIAYQEALAGVRPLPVRASARMGAWSETATGAPAPEERVSDALARARLASVVAAGVQFEIRRDEGWIEGIRRGASPSVLRALQRARIPDSDTLDLHGARASEAAERVARFVRDAHRAGVRRIRIVHGKGLHSEGGGVLAEVVLRVLTEGAAAARTIAFVTAPPEQGGAGALLVELAGR